MNELVQLITSWEFWLVAVACGAIGFVIKQVPKVPDWAIPIINLIIAPLGMMALCGFTPFYGIVGILAASLATYAYELFHQVIKGLSSSNGEVDVKVGGTDD